MARVSKKQSVACVLVLAAAVLLVLASRGGAFALDGEDVRGEFSSQELRQLFIESDDSDYDFLACDYTSGGIVSGYRFLKINPKYKTRYDHLLNSISKASEANEGVEPQLLNPSYPLVRVNDVATAPWSKILYTTLYARDENGQPYQKRYANGFMVANRIGFTAAHVVHPTTTFAERVFVGTSINGAAQIVQGHYVKTAVIPRKFAESATQVGGFYAFDQDYDFALLIFSQPVVNAAGCFSYGSLAEAGSIASGINLACYLDSYNGNSGICLFRNSRNGYVGSNYPDDQGYANIYEVVLSCKSGSSGSPIYSVRAGRYIATGILVAQKPESGSDPSDDTAPGKNYACRITGALQCLECWAEATIAAEGSGSSPGTGGVLFARRGVSGR